MFMDAAIVHLVYFKGITYMESCSNDLHYLQTNSVILGCHLNQPYPMNVLSVSHFSLLSVSSCHSSTAYTCWMRVHTLLTLQTTGQTVALCRLCSHVRARTRTHTLFLYWRRAWAPALWWGQPADVHGFLVSVKASKSLGPFKQHTERAIVNAKR
jgi:hypothetical protein